MNSRPLLYTYYGDDFTGSTDVLEQLALNGVSAALFFAPPSPQQLARFPALRAFGIAGDARSQTPAWMDEHLPPVFEALRAFGAPVTHYKVCSTFDSSPAIGSIGRAIEIGLRVFDPPFVPVVVGAPHLRRFVLEGRLFAAAPGGAIHRIDRHPMRRHPVTPMREPSLAKHLSLQTSEPIGLVAHDDLASAGRAQEAIRQHLSAGERVLLFDTVDASSLAQIGRLLWTAALVRPLFSASSSGLTAALISAWREQGLLDVPPPPTVIPRRSALLVISGSCSPATAQQVRWALGHGFHGVRLDASQWPDMESAAERARITAGIAQQLNSDRDVVVYTALGDAPAQVEGASLGAALGQLASEVLRRTAVERILFCGGDTSSHAVQQLDLFALTWLASLDPGAPLCLAHRHHADARRLELILKGGQVGAEDFFARARGA